MLHSCTVGNNSMIGMGAIVLDGAVVEKDRFLLNNLMLRDGVF